MQNHKLGKFTVLPKRGCPGHSLCYLPTLLACWWEGQSRAQIATSCGVSSRTIGALLARAGYARRRRRLAGRGLEYGGTASWPSSHELSPRAARALQMLQHRWAIKLTQRQLAAAAWTAQGLSSAQVAIRMDTSPQRVRQALIAAGWRLQRLAGKATTRAAASDESGAGPTLDWGPMDVETPPSDAPVSAGDGAVGTAVTGDSAAPGPRNSAVTAKTPQLTTAEFRSDCHNGMN